MQEFTDKYTSTGRLGQILLDRYFKSLDKLIKEIPQRKLRGGSVLEIGCGAGFSTERILRFLPKGVELFASDFEVENVKDARERLSGKALVEREDVYNLKREENSFSLVFLLEVLEHLTDPEKALAETRRIGRDYFIFSVPREPLWRILRMLSGKYLRDFGNTPGHIQHWGRKSFRRLIEKNGFEAVKMYSPFPWVLVLAKKNKG